MAEKGRITLKDIAELAGVSIGTVYRVLHNNGRFSDETKGKVLRIIEEHGYKSSLHASANSMRRRLKFVIVLPDCSDGDYWSCIKDGIVRAVADYGNIPLDVDYVFYDRQDRDACSRTYEKIPEMNPDAVIIGSIFSENTIELCKCLEHADLPYFFVDTAVEGTKPVAVYSVDQRTAGMLMGRLADIMSSETSDIMILDADRYIMNKSDNYILRKQGFDEFIAKESPEREVWEAVLYTDTSMNDKIESLLQSENIGCVVVMNSRGYIIADLICNLGVNNVKVIGFDLTKENAERLRAGSITALIDQKPFIQGYRVMKAAITHVVYNSKSESRNVYLHADVLMKESLIHYDLQDVREL